MMGDTESSQSLDMWYGNGKVVSYMPPGNVVDVARSLMNTGKRRVSPNLSNDID